jgi:NADH-quinone oxidoreductase subunit B
MADNFNERDFFTGNALIPGETQSVYAPPPGGGVFTTKLSVLANWAQSASLFPMIMGTACCAIEGMATAGSRFDGLERFGMLFRFSPRQCDAMVVFGRVSAKMAPVIRQLYDQMPEPKWVVAVGACASCGGVFNNYAIVQGIDKIVPVDVYVAGCPPTPEAIMEGLNMLQQKIVSGAPHPRDPQEYMPEVVRDPNLGRVQH